MCARSLALAAGGFDCAGESRALRAGMRRLLTERDFALSVVRTLRDAGFQALWAGGCVRDQLLGLEPHDYDVATDARPDQVRPLFRRTIEVGASFGVVEVIGPRVDGEHLKVQVATFRTEGPYTDGRRPDRVEFATAEADALRRDFTINGMFFDPLAGQVLDYVGGQADLEARVLRAIGDPYERLREDKLRLLRAVRIVARFSLCIEERTRAAIMAMADQITVVSAERITDEFHQMLVHPTRVAAMNLLRELGLWRALLPELEPTSTSSAAWERLMRVLANLHEPSFALAFAALLADAGSETADKIARRFKLSNADRERIAWLIEHRRSLADAQRMRASKLKPILVHPGIGELLALHRAEALADGASSDHVEFCENQLSQTPRAELDPPPLLTGDDLIAAGFTPGPRFKQVLERVREAQLDGEIQSKEAAREMARKVWQG